MRALLPAVIVISIYSASADVAQAQTPLLQWTAQAGRAVPPPDGTDAPPPAPRAPLPPRGSDPTVPGPDIRALIDDKPTTAVAAPAPPAVPTIRLRARIIARDRPPVAVVNFGEQAVVVRQNEELQVNSPGEGPLQLKVVQVNALGVQIEVVNRRQVITLN